MITQRLLGSQRRDQGKGIYGKEEESVHHLSPVQHVVGYKMSGFSPSRAHCLEFAYTQLTPHLLRQDNTVIAKPDIGTHDGL